MKIKRSQIEELILLISPDTDVHLFPKRDLLAVLAHEILHLKGQRSDRMTAMDARTVYSLILRRKLGVAPGCAS